jgi:hypothetical protein
VNRDGNLVWARVFETSGTASGISLIDIDNAGSIYLAGDFSGSIDLDPAGSSRGILSAQDTGRFLAKFDRSGAFQWARGIGFYPMDMLSDNQGIYFCGAYTRDVGFDPGPDAPTDQVYGIPDAFLSRFDPQGNFQWVQTWGGPGSPVCWNMRRDSTGDIYIAGYFFEQVDFEPGPSQDLHDAGDTKAAFLSKFDSMGNWAWTQSWPNLNVTRCSSMACDPAGNVYISGNVFGVYDGGAATQDVVIPSVSSMSLAVDLDPGSGIYYRVPRTNDKGLVESPGLFTMKLLPDGSW